MYANSCSLTIIRPLNNASAVYIVLRTFFSMSDANREFVGRRLVKLSFHDRLAGEYNKWRYHAVA